MMEHTKSTSVLMRIRAALWHELSTSVLMRTGVAFWHCKAVLTLILINWSIVQSFWRVMAWSLTGCGRRLTLLSHWRFGNGTRRAHSSLLGWRLGSRNTWVCSWSEVMHSWRGCAVRSVQHWLSGSLLLQLQILQTANQCRGDWWWSGRELWGRENTKACRGGAWATARSWSWAAGQELTHSWITARGWLWQEAVTRSLATDSVLRRRSAGQHSTLNSRVHSTSCHWGHQLYTAGWRRVCGLGRSNWVQRWRVRVCPRGIASQTGFSLRRRWWWRRRHHLWRR